MSLRLLAFLLFIVFRFDAFSHRLLLLLSPPRAVACCSDPDTFGASKRNNNKLKHYESKVTIKMIYGLNYVSSIGSTDGFTIFARIDRLERRVATGTSRPCGDLQLRNRSTAAQVAYYHFAKAP